MKNTVLIFALNLITGLLLGQSTFNFTLSSNKVEGTNGNLVELPNNQYILSVGESSSFNNKFVQKFYKLNTAGDSIQSMKIEKDSTCGCGELTLISDNKILCIGEINHQYGSTDMWIVCIDSILNLQWEKTYPLPENYKTTSVRFIPTNDGNAVILYGLTLGNWDNAFLLFKITLDGDSIKSSFFGPNHATIFDIEENPNTSDLIVPVIGFATQTNTPGQIMVFDSSLYLRLIDSTPENVSNGSSIKILDDEHYFLAGNKSYPFNEESYNIALLLMNYQNNSLNSVAVGRAGDTIELGAAYQTLDFKYPGNIYIAGNSMTQLSGYMSYLSTWFLLSRFDSDLNLYWTKYFGGDACYVLQSVTATSDGGAIVAGTRFDYLNHPENQLDVYVLKIDSTGLYTNVDEEKPVPVHDAIVYPNPGSDYLVVQSGPQVCGAFFRMYDMQGRLVMEQRLTSTLLRLSTNTLAAGTYPWQIIFNNKAIESGKWVKEK